jgi:hypothetical protein
MELYVPSLVSFSVAFLIILVCFILRPPIIFIGILSAVALAITAYVHITMYRVDYRNFIFDTSIQAHATWILVFAMIVFSVGYILMLPKGTAAKDLFSTKPLFSTPTIDKSGTKKPTGPSILDYWFGDAKEQSTQDYKRDYDDRNYDKYLRKQLALY